MIKGCKDLEKTAGLPVERRFFITEHNPLEVLGAAPPSSEKFLKEHNIIVMNLLDWLLREK